MDELRARAQALSRAVEGMSGWDEQELALLSDEEVSALISELEPKAAKIEPWETKLFSMDPAAPYPITLWEWGKGNGKTTFLKALHEGKSISMDFQISPENLGLLKLITGLDKPADREDPKGTNTQGA